MIGFSIDETKFTKVDDVVLVVRRLNSLLSVIHEHHGQQVYKSTDLDFVEVLDGIELWSLLYDETLALLDHDDRILLIAALNQCIGMEGIECDITIDEVSLAGKPVESRASRFAIDRALSKETVGVIHANPMEYLGPLDAMVGDRSTKVYHVGLTLPLEQFYRFMMAFEEMPRQEFSKWTDLAFERLRSALDPSTQISRFKQKYEIIRRDIIEHLSAINDEFVSLLIEGGELSDICRSIKASCGVDISPESPNTRRNAKAMKLRRVDFESSSIVCEFHSKLTATHDRIHFSPILRRSQDNRPYVVVGPFADHLPT